LLGPIFVREWRTLPRRPGHYVARTAYLGLLWLLGLTAWQLLVGWDRTATLSQTARFGQVLFALLSYVALTLFLFFAAFWGANAVSQEKDRRTFLLLLLTDLRHYEIVLGKLGGALLPSLLLLLSGVPLLTLLLLLGGVAGDQIWQVAVVVGAASLAAGSLGGLMALWRDQSFQAVALTFLLLVLALVVTHAIELSWLAPYLALQRVLDPPRYATPLPPGCDFALGMLGVSTVLNGIGMWRLRAWNPRGEPIQQRERPEADDDKDRARAHAAPGPVRSVWANPILWREIRTRAYGRRLVLVQAAYFVACGLCCYYAFALLDDPNGRVPFAAAYGLLPTSILALVLVSAQSVSAITTERDLHSLDLLLVTDLTPREFIFGKLGGIAFHSVLYVLPPLLLACYYAWRGFLASAPRGHPELIDVTRNVQALGCILGTLVVLGLFTMVFGVHVGLRTENSRTAVVHVLATVFFLSVGTLVCIWLILINGRFEYQWGSFVWFLIAGVGGLWWVLNGERPSRALTLASWLCPFALFYAVLNVLIGKPGTEQSSEPWLPFLVIAASFGLAIAAMLVPLLSEFDLALGRTGGGNE
jgi:ABC-type transport system involved in multi-copper enzyme maturation permease subunit